MADNYVQISIKASDDGATADIDALSARLDELKAKRADMTASLDDKEAVAGLTSLDAKIEALGAKIARPRVTLAGAARAEADMAALDVAMDKYRAKADEAAVKSAAGMAAAGAEMDKVKAKADSADAQGVVSRLLMGKSGSSGGSGLAGLLEKLPVLGNSLSSVAEDLGKMGGEGDEAGEAMGSLAVDAPVAAAAIGAVGVAVGAALVELDGLIAGVAAAGLGVGAFGALAYPTFEKIFGAVGDTKSQLAKLSPPIRDAAEGVRKLEDSFKGAAKAFQPDALKVFNEGLSVANDLMPYLSKFANAAAPAIEGLMKSLDKKIDSSGFKSFMADMERISPAAITAIGNGMMKLASDVGHLLEKMSKKDVVNAINIAFSVLSGTIRGISSTISFVMHSWDRLTSALDALKSHTSGLRSSWQSDWNKIKAAAEPVISKIKSDIASLVSWWDQHWGTIRAVLTVVWDAMSELVRLQMDIITGTIKTAVTLIGAVWQTAWDLIKNTVKLAWDFIAGQVRTGTDVITGIIKVVGDVMNGNWSKAWNDMRTYGSKAMGDIETSIKRIGGDFGNLLWDAGRDLVMGLVHGMEAQAGSAMSAAESLAKSVVHAFTAHIRIGSPSKLFEEHGKAIVDGLVNGITGNTGRATAAMRHLAQQVGATSFGTGGTAGAFGAGGTQRVQLEFSGADDAMSQALRKMIRVKGGNVQRVLGTGAA